MPQKQEKRPAILSLTAGMIAGGIEGVITYPTEYIKTQLQIRKNSLSPIQFLRQTVRERGIFALYKGLGPLVIGSRINRKLNKSGCQVLCIRRI